MSSKEVICSMRTLLEDFVGCVVDVDANVGRKKIVPYEGVLEDIYPNVFIVKVDNDDGDIRRLSFSYVDLFTGNVTVRLHRDGRVYRFAKNE